MPVGTSQLFRWQTLTGLVNLERPTLNLLASLLFSDHETLSTSSAELSYLVGDRETAPMVKTGAAGIFVPGDDDRFAEVETPNIRIKGALNPKKLVDERQAGQGLYVGLGESGPVLTGAQRYVARRLSRLNQRIDNTIEILCSQLLQGAISYDVAGGDSFTITLPRDSALDTAVASTANWNSAGANKDIPGDFELAKDLIHERLGLTVTHALMGKNAATAFRKEANTGGQLAGLLDNRQVELSGPLRLDQNFNAQGAIRYGNLFGVECWQYARTINYLGSATPMIRDDYVEFVCATPEAENVMYFGAIPDMDAIEGGGYVGERFSKSWIEKDPGHRILLAHSRPLPWKRKADSTMSLKVVNVS